MTHPHRTIGIVTLLVAVLALLSGCSTTETGNTAAAQHQAMLMQQQAQAEQPSVNNRQVHLDMIRIMQARNLYFASLAHIDAYESVHGSNTEIQLLRADALRMTGQHDLAEASYRKLLKSNEAASARHGLGLMAAQDGKYPQAVDELRESVRLAPLNAAALGDLGYALLIAGRHDEARIPLIQAMELAPDNRKIISNLALFLLVTGDDDKATALMEKTSVPPGTRKEIVLRAQQLQPNAFPASLTHHPENAVATASTGVQLRLQTSLAPSSSLATRARTLQQE